ncbi:MAG: GHKL domain-containing protein [Oscillospiraceae bacterium]|nr:GHKL domain-containing protein [Oscillospiraceae bacterium]
MQYFNLFLRCFESAVGLAAMIIVLSKHRENFKTRCIIFGIAILIACALLMAVSMFAGEAIVPRIALPILFVLMFGGLIITSADKWQVKLFNLFTFLSVYILVSFMSESLTLFIPNPEREYFYFAFRAVLFAAVIFLEYRFVRKPFRRMVNIVQNEWNFAVIIAAAFFILNVLLSSYHMMDHYNLAYNNLMVSSAYVLMTFVYFCICVFLQNVVLRYEKEQTHAAVTLQLSSLERQIEMQKIAAEDIRRARHDLRHNCMVAIGQITSGDHDGAVRFLKQFTDLIEVYSIKSYCMNNAINCVFSSLAEKAEKAGISFEIKANIPERFLKIDEVELASVFANAFENAIEGCQNSGSASPFITISADYSDSRVLLSIKNTCGHVEFEDGLAVSTKPGGGNGTKSISYFTQKYHGIADFSSHDNVFVMQAFLLDE